MGPADPFTQMGTLGIEEEFFVVDEDGRPTSGTDELVYESEPPDAIAGRLDHELFKFVIEVQTPTLSGLGEARSALEEVRGALVDHAEAHGYRIAAAGLHPAAKWRDLEHAEKPRYRDQLDRIQYPQHRNTTAGLHVHVGVDDADKATWIANELRWHLPVVLALSANSPFWCGFDTGLESARAKIFEALPNTGVPTAFRSFEDFVALERAMLETDSIHDRGELWWDVRPHTEHGTVEVRTPDAQADTDRVLAIVEYVHALVTDFGERYEARSDPWATYETPPGVGADRPPRRELLEENKWRALRYGHEASLIDPDGSGVTDLGTLVDAECERLDVSGIGELYAAESGATRQRRLLEADGEESLYESLIL